MPTAVESNSSLPAVELCPLSLRHLFALQRLVMANAVKVKDAFPALPTQCSGLFSTLRYIRGVQKSATTRAYVVSNPSQLHIKHESSVTFLEKWRSKGAEAGGTFWTSTKSRMRGMVVLESEDETTAHVRGWVDETDYGKRYATASAVVIDGIARGFGYRRLHAYIPTNAAPAIRLAESAGFEPEEDPLPWDIDEGPPRPRQKYVLSLTEHHTTS